MQYWIFCLFFLSFGAHLQGDIMIIGHRGACGYAPENTLASFAKALEFNVEAVELDVHLAKSGELVVIHDEKIDRVSNGKGYVAEKTLEELKQYTLDEGEKIPTLEEVCDLIDRKCVINIELKGVATAGPVAKLITRYIVEKGWKFGDFFVSSFNHHELFAFHRILPQVQTGALLEGIPLHYAAFATDVGASHIVLYYQTIDELFIKDAHNRGLKVFVYPVDEPEEMERLIKIGVDGIITNYPDRGKSFFPQN